MRDLEIYLNTPYKVTSQQILFYQKNNYIKIKHIFPPQVIEFLNATITDEVVKKSQNNIPLEKRDTYGKAFLQIMNLWLENEEIKKLIFSKRLAGIATSLMQVTGVRLYHDQALFKEAGGGITPWHADQYYWPLSNENTVTVWIPLQAIPLEMGPLEFSAGSQKIEFGRSLAISDESENLLTKKLRVTDFPHIVEAFDIGEVSFHSGWVFHRAGANTTDHTRKVMTIIYMDKDVRLIEPENKNQENDRNTWCPGVEVGEVIDSPINPVLFEF